MKKITTTCDFCGYEYTQELSSSMEESQPSIYKTVRGYICWGCLNAALKLLEEETKRNKDLQETP